MSKEIFEQPISVKNGINEYVDKIKNDIKLYNFPIDPKKIEKIVLIACGTAYYSCLVAKYWFEELTKLDVEIDVASEFRYRNIKFNKRIYMYSFLNQVRQLILQLHFNYVETTKLRHAQL